MRNRTDKLLIFLLVALVIGYVVYLQQRDSGIPIAPIYAATLPDTIKPVITTTCADSAYPRLFEAAFHNSTSVSQGSFQFTFRTFNLGKLKCESGKIIACDMINMHLVQPFAQLFPKGDFPVQLSMVKIGNSERVAFSRILFSTDSVVRWEYALLPDQKPILLNDSIMYCYSVDAATAIFIDSSANYDFSGKGEQAWNDAFMNRPESELTSGYIYPFDDSNLAVFSTGEGDGCYATYIGYDATGEPCRLLTDFGLVYWWNIKQQ